MNFVHLTLNLAHFDVSIPPTKSRDNIQYYHYGNVNTTRHLPQFMKNVNENVKE